MFLYLRNGAPSRLRPRLGSNPLPCSAASRNGTYFAYIPSEVPVMPAYPFLLPAASRLLMPCLRLTCIQPVHYASLISRPHPAYFHPSPFT